MIPLLTDDRYTNPANNNNNTNSNNPNNNDNDDDNDDAQSDISVPYSSLTESTTSLSTSSFLTPTVSSSDADTVAGGDSDGGGGANLNLHTINSVLNNHHGGDEEVDDALAQWRSLYQDEIERQIIENRNRDRDQQGGTTTTMAASSASASSNYMSLSAGNLRLHTSQMSTTLAGSEVRGGGGEGRREDDESSSTSSAALPTPASIKFVFSLHPTNLKFKFTTRHFFALSFFLGSLFSFACLHLTVSSFSRSTATTTMSHSRHDDLLDQEFPPLTILSPAPASEIASHTRSSTPTPTVSKYESAPSSPTGTQKGQTPHSRYTRHAPPLPNQTFIILEASTGRALTLIDGNLRLVHVPDPDLISITDSSPSSSSASSNGGSIPPCEVAKGQCNWHWHCVETAGWLGFRNAASGTFLGHDMWQNIIARVYKHQGWEWMAVRPAPDGKGWYLMVTHWERLYKVKFLEQKGGAFVAMDSVDGTVWEFVKV